MRKPSCAENNVVVSRQPIATFERRSDDVPDLASCSVRANHIAGAQFNITTDCEIPQANGHAVSILMRGDELLAKSNLDGRQGLYVLPHDVFQLVLGNPLRMFRVGIILVGRAVKRIGKARERMAAQSRREDDIRGIVDAKGGSFS